MCCPAAQSVGIVQFHPRAQNRIVDDEEKHVLKKKHARDPNASAQSRNISIGDHCNPMLQL